jgi:ribosomal 30S subunit maturation factor RimM
VDKKFNPNEFFQKVTETEATRFEKIQRTKVVDYFLRSIKEEYPCLELDTYFYQMLLMSKVFEMSHQGYKVDEIEETMRKNKEDLIAEYRELIKNINIKDE